MAEEKSEESQVPEESEFEAAFAEFADKETTETPEPEPDEPAAKAPDEKPGEDEAVEAEGKKDPEPEGDVYAGMSEAARKELDDLKKANEEMSHRLKSDAGRVSAFQRQINDLKSEMSEMRAAADTGSRPTNKQIADAMKGTDEDWEEFTQDYPQVAAAIDKRLAAMGEAAQESINSTLEPVQKQLSEVATNQTTAANQAAVDAVAEVYPTWTAAVQTTEFAEWLDQQSPGVNALASSDDAQDAKTLIGLYDAHLVAEGKDSLRAPDPTEPGVNKDEEANGGKEPSELEKRRSRQLQDGTAIPSKPAGIDPGGEAGNEFEQAFDYYARKKLAQNA